MNVIDKGFLSGTGLRPFHLKPGEGHFPRESSQHGMIQTLVTSDPGGL